MNSQTASEYVARINRTFDYIEKNLSKQLTLEELANVAGFSKYHFTRLFHGMVGETPFQFINRIRIERSATLLMTSGKSSVSDITFQCGFTDIAIFSRNFRNHFGMSPTRYRHFKREKSNISQQQSNFGQEETLSSSYFCSITNTLKWRLKMETNKSIEIQNFPKMTVAYIRHTGPYQGDEKLFERLWNQLFTWACPRGLIGGPDFKSLVIYHDDPNITESDKLRMSVCITVPAETKIDGEIGKMEIDPGNYVVARFHVDATQFGEAWQWLYGVWFPTSGYQPDDKPCFEMYPEEPKDGKFVVDICVPVKPL